MKVEELIDQLQQYKGMNLELAAGFPECRHPLPSGFIVEKYDDQFLLMTPIHHHIRGRFCDKTQLLTMQRESDERWRKARELMDRPDTDPELNLLEALNVLHSSDLPHFKP